VAEPLDLSLEPACAQTGAVPITSAPISTAADESHLEYNICGPSFQEWSDAPCSLFILPESFYCAHGGEKTAALL
jgi:hypothetical protein